MLRAGCISLLAAASMYSADLPGCEPRPEVRQALDRELSPQATRDLKFVEARALRFRVLNRLVADYPREIEPHRRLIITTRSEDPDRLSALQAKYRKNAVDHPDDPLALYLAAYALFRTNTPESIHLAQDAEKLAPDFPAAHQLLSEAYQGGNFEDKPKAAAYLARYLTLCPGATNAAWTMEKVGTPELRAKTAAALRARLEKDTDPKRLLDYDTLWGFEFRSRPPSEHDALRKIVADDVKRLEQLNPKPDAQYLALLVTGYKQSGGSSGAVTAAEDRLLRDAPSSAEAYRIAYARWDKQHKMPEDQKDKAAWDAWRRAYLSVLEEWIPRFTDVRYLPSQRLYWMAQDDCFGDDDLLRAVAESEAAAAYSAPNASFYTDLADGFVRRKLAPDRALDLLARADPLIRAAYARRAADDTLTLKDRDMLARDKALSRAEFLRSLLKASALAHRPDAVVIAAAEIEGAPPGDKTRLSLYWRNRALFAALQSRKTDALAYYQAALQTRQEPPRYVRGKLEDELGDEAKALWKEMGGTEAAYQQWAAAPQTGTNPAEGRWERPTKDLQFFELVDLSGKTWKLKQLEGKAVLINLWATWCGPCKSELPKLERLYQSVKDRADLQILTFNIDEDLGLVAPFLKEGGYTFPVLVAADLVNKLYDGWAIPQNWIIDPGGKWQWVQIGYDSTEPDWIGAMLRRLDSVRAPSK